MRKFLIFASVVLLVAYLATKNPAWLPGWARSAASAVALPFRLAALSAKEADAELSVPVGGVRAAQVRDSWHAPRSNGRQHEGQDIFAPHGTPVYSATEGYVVKIGESELGGSTVFVHGAGGRWYYYAHLDSYAPGLKVGDYVTPDTVLGRVGSTGNAAGTPPHLHFGVYTAAGAIDPLPLLVDRK
ncbi:MAG TPA: M23 family metallopeptidase [Pyrinomonadaceae bacterium]|nr:M23 family metallopeptidase [Pyrinomonadaceae bacterium]